MKLIMRKIQEIMSGMFRHLIYPMIRLITEISTKSIMKQGSYMNKGSRLSGRNFLGRDVYLTHTQLGFGSYVAEGGRLIDTRVGKYCSIGPEISCAFGKHPSNTFISTHPAFYSASAAEGFTYRDKTVFAEEEYADKENGFRVIVGNDVWIGARVTLLEGITIGDGAIIAAGAVVTKDIEPYAIYGGVPAKKIGTRFLDETDIEQIKSSHWWDMDESKLKELAQDGYFDDIEHFRL